MWSLVVNFITASCFSFFYHSFSKQRYPKEVFKSIWQTQRNNGQKSNDKITIETTTDINIGRTEFRYIENMYMTFQKGVKKAKDINQKYTIRGLLKKRASTSPSSIIPPHVPHYQGRVVFLMEKNHQKSPPFPCQCYMGGGFLNYSR